MNRLVGVVTGGTRGIGRGLAEYLLEQGARVAVTYHTDDEAAEKARQDLERSARDASQLAFLKGDAGDSEVVNRQHREVHKTFGVVNVLINNAGIMPQHSFEELTPEIWEQTIRVNLNSAFYWCREVVPGMKKQGFGRIVNMASLAARGGGVVGPHYAASKAGMLGLTRYGARELGPFGITVNAINPAFIQDAGIFAGWSEKDRAELKDKTVVPELGGVKDVVRAFAYLLESPFVTGVALDVNGGAFMI
mgnify:CR=1 FL=1